MRQVTNISANTAISELMEEFWGRASALVAKSPSGDCIQVDFKVTTAGGTCEKSLVLPAHLVLQEQAGNQVIPFSADPPELVEDGGVPISEILGYYEKFAKTKQCRNRKGTQIDPDTVAKNLSHFRRFCKRHDLGTFEELEQMLDDFDYEDEVEARINSTEAEVAEAGGFIAMLRGCSSIFKNTALLYYKQNCCINLANPFAAFGTQKEPEPYRPPPGGKAFWTNSLERLMNEQDALVVDLYLICRQSGTRVQEAAHLQWKHLQDWGDGIFKLEILSRKKHQTKNRKSRTVPIPEGLYWHLIQQRPQTATDDDWIIPDEHKQLKENRKVRGHGVACRLRKWLRANGLDRPNPIHELRKAYGSEIATNHGVLTASNYLGHSSTAVTEKIYVTTLKHVTVEDSNSGYAHNVESSAYAPGCEESELQGTATVSEPDVPPMLVAVKAFPITPVATKLSPKIRQATHDILSHLKVHGATSPGNLDIQLGLYPASRKRAITALLDEDSIQRSGTTRSVLYELKEEQDNA